MTKSEVKALQRGLNFFVLKYLDNGFPPILVDGKRGAKTNRRIQWIKYFLGYDGSVNKQNSVVNHAFLSRMWHPKNTRYSTRERIIRGNKRRIAQRAKWAKNKTKARLTTGVGRYDGVPVANVAIPILEWCRKNGWHGRLVSGWRDPVYSRSLCRAMCGRDFCPGRCAGLSSNHVGSTAARFAVDVSDFVTFERVVAHCPISPRIRNLLDARDPVHFSPSGN
jgi:hypothetical protein